MNKVIVLLCLVLAAGCATVAKEEKIAQPVKPRETVVVDQKELDELIAIFSEAIREDPDSPGPYYNRAIAYFHKGDYDKSWQDMHSAEQLGVHVDAKFMEFLAKLKKESGRDN